MPGLPAELRQQILEDNNVTQIVLQVVIAETGVVIIRDVYEVRTREEKESVLLDIALKCLVFRHLPADAPSVIVVVYPKTEDSAEV